MQTFYISNMDDAKNKDNIENLLDALSQNFPDNILKVKDVIQVETDCEELFPLFERLSNEAPGVLVGQPSKKKARPVDNGHGEMRPCAWCGNLFVPRRKDQKCDTKECSKNYFAEKQRNLEFQIVETGKKFSAIDLKKALKNGEFVTGTRIDNFKTGDKFYVNMKSDADKVEYELLQQPIEA